MRTDMIIAHDTLPKLGAIKQPTLGPVRRP